MKGVVQYSIVMFLCGILSLTAQVGIGTTDPDPSTALHVKSTTQGMLVPRMDSTQRNLINNAANGLLVFDISTNTFWFFQDDEWKELIGGTAKSDGLSDKDGDTKIQVEKETNDNTIRFDVNGFEAMTLTPTGNLQIRGDNPDDAGFIELFNSDATQFLRLFSGRTGDPEPFLAWKSGFPFRFVSSENDFSVFNERMRIDNNGNVGIGTPSPSQSAILDLSSTEKGLLSPRMSTIERANIISPANGLFVYDTDTKSFWYYEDNVWNEILSVSKQSFYNNTTIQNIPDCNLNGIVSTINITGNDIVSSRTSFEVCIDIVHPYTADLGISLEAPNGEVIILSSDNGASGDNYTNTCFNSDATNSITTGIAPFIGEWIPEEPFSNIIGSNIAGAWKLRVSDLGCGSDIGVFNNWSLTIKNPKKNNPNGNNIGDIAHGGIVFWVDDTGEHGLVCAFEDELKAPGNPFFKFTDSTRGIRYTSLNNGINGGLINTILVLQDEAATGGSFSTAISSASTATHGGFADWYVPSLVELQLLYTNLHQSGLGDFSLGTYWSSNKALPDGFEDFIDDTYTLDFQTGVTTQHQSRYDEQRVRSIRAF